MLVNQYVIPKPADNPMLNRLRADFVASLARRCLTCGDRESTTKLIKLGQELEPNHPELAYLSRILSQT
jgi:hypothetical protein